MSLPSESLPHPFRESAPWRLSPQQVSPLREPIPWWVSPQWVSPQRVYPIAGISSESLPHGGYPLSRSPASESLPHAEYLLSRSPVREYLLHSGFPHWWVSPLRRSLHIHPRGRVKRVGACNLLSPQAQAVLCFEDTKEILIWRRGTPTRASAVGEESGF